MAEKQRGRPKREQNAKIDEIGQDQIAKTKENLEEKVIEAKTAKPETKSEPTIKIRPSQRNRGMHEVIVKGKSRQMTKLSYEALVKDPKLEVTLPKGSLLVEPVITPCKDC